VGGCKEECVGLARSSAQHWYLHTCMHAHSHTLVTCIRTDTQTRAHTDTINSAISLTF